MSARSLQLCLTLRNAMDWNLSGSSVHGILQARKLKWLPCPPPGDLPHPGIGTASSALQADSLPLRLSFILNYNQISKKLEKLEEGPENGEIMINISTKYC